MKKVAIITGASSGIGYHLYKNLKDDYEVFNFSRHSVDTPCDIRYKQSIKAALKNINKVDLLINNAGIMFFNKFENITEDEIDNMYDTHVKGTLLMIQAVLPLMKNGGNIINISSIRGITSAPTKGAYSASKFAVQGLTDSLRLELGKSNIKITNICPGKVPDSVKYSDINSTVRYILSLSDVTIIRNIILGGQL